jgi:hypothetical protein
VSDPAAAICTTAAVKSVLAITASTYDTQIEGIIGAVAGLAERVCGRTFIVGASDVTEYYSIEDEKDFFYANRKPPNQTYLDRLLELSVSIEQN